jgi:hypothetical protein
MWIAFALLAMASLASCGTQGVTTELGNDPGTAPVSTEAGDRIYLGADGKVVIYAERAPANGWATETALGDYTGSSYYRWAGPRQTNPGTGSLAYRFQVDQSGDYAVRFRLNAPRNDANDLWARLDGGPWYRVNTHVRGAWTLNTVIQVDGVNRQWFERLVPGVTYTLEVTALGSGLSLDQVRIWRQGVTGLHTTTEPESAYIGDEQTPDPDPEPEPEPDPEPEVPPPAGPSPEYDHLIQIHVNPSHPSASDLNAGTEAAPLATIRAGLDAAFTLRRVQGKGARVLVYPGTYRETINTVYANVGDALIVVESLEPRKAIISGSDVWLNWACVGGICTKSWPYDWGTAENPWANNVEIGPLARRREIVFVNGQNLDQHLSLSELTPGSFFVDEVADKIHLMPPSGVNLAQATVEVGVRGHLLRAQALHDVVLKGLVFQHSASPFRTSAVEIVDQRNVLLEDCEIRWNGQGGLSLLGHDLHVRDCEMSNNGSSGVTATRSTNVSLTDTETATNNWRGYRVNYMTWAVGHKFSRLHGLTITRHRSVDNMTRGLWLDTDVKDAVLDGLYLCGNKKDGIFLEALQGPITIRNSVICNNTDAGILGGTVVGLTLEGNRIEHNAGDQIRISGTANRKITDWRTGTVMYLNSEGWRVHGNTVTGSGSQLLYETTLSSTNWNHLISTSSFDRNRYAQPNASKVFRVGGGGLVTFSEWRTRVSDEANSTFGP